MTLMSDIWIKEQSTTNCMISPFTPHQVKKNKLGGIISYGLSSYGYDARVSSEFKIFIKNDHANIDPKEFSEKNIIHQNTKVCLIPPNSFILAKTIEYLVIPKNILALCIGKSTYARCGIVINTTPLEPGWRGYITLELSNTTPLPAKIYAGEGICQILFFQGNTTCNLSYADRVGKYMNQLKITLPKI